ncbi:ABC transporter permease [Leucobacter sp. HY1910]
MNLFADALTWLLDPAQWSGTGSIPVRLGQHLALTVVVIVVGSAIALPAGVAIGHTRRGAAWVGGVAGAARALPTLGLLTLFGLALGIGVLAPVLALVILAIPSLLAGAYAGVQAVDPAVPDAAKAVGMTPLQVVWQAELPLALPVLVGGVRAATLQVVSTLTLAAYVADAGLGRYLFAGLKTRDYAQMLAGALLVVALTLLLDLFLGLTQRAVGRVAQRAHPTVEHKTRKVIRS